MTAACASSVSVAPLVPGLCRREQRALDLCGRESGPRGHDECRHARDDRSGRAGSGEALRRIRSERHCRARDIEGIYAGHREPGRPDVDGPAPVEVPPALEVRARERCLRVGAEASDAEHTRGLARPVVRRLPARDEAAQLVDVDSRIARRGDEQRSPRPHCVGGCVEEGRVESSEGVRDRTAEAHVDDARAPRLQREQTALDGEDASRPC